MTKRDSTISPREAIKMVTSCQRERLPYVLSILEKEGYDFSDAVIELARATSMTGAEKKAAKRTANGKVFMESNDQVVLLIRDAYSRGVSFTDISKMSGVSRTALYAYMKCDRGIPEVHRKPLSDAIEKILSELHRQEC